jgi:methionyl-tRNA formyltransferase
MIIFLTSESIHHYYLINEINKYHPVKKVFFQTKHKEQGIWKNRLKQLTTPKNIRFVIRGLLTKILFGKEKVLREQYEAKMFFNNTTPSLNPSIYSEKVFSFNCKETVAKVKNENPELIIVFGTEILKGEILKVAKLNILNIHRDILPKYRGGGLPFWIFYNKDFGNLGTTVHVCAQKLDAGDIVGQKYYKLQKDDKIYTLRYKTTILAVDILKEVIDKYKNGTVEYKKQEKTKLWTSKNMTIIKEIIARRNFNKYIKTLSK